MLQRLKEFWNKNNINTVITTKIVFFIFFLFLIIQYSRVFFYSDDFGYGSMTYAVHSEKDGLAGFLDYLHLHYLKWGGRVLYYSVLILGLKSGLFVMRSIEVFIMFSSFVLIYKICRKNSHPTGQLKTAVITCACFGTFDIFIASQSLYWFSSAITYTGGFFFSLLFLFLIYYKMNETEKLSATKLAGYCWLAFITGFSHELYALASCCVYVVLFLFHSKHNKLKYTIIGFFLGLGSALVILAPGNFNRNKGRSFVPSVEVLLSRARDLLKMIFSFQMYHYILVLSIALLLAATFYLVCKKQPIYLIFITFFSIILFFYLKNKCLVSVYEKNSTFQLVLMGMYYPVALLEIILVCKKNVITIISFIMGLITAGAMVFNSDISLRTLTPLVLFSIVAIVNLFQEVTFRFHIDKIILVAVCCVLINNIYAILVGYQSNYTTNSINWMKLRTATYEQPKRIVLYKAINDRYGYVQPYMYNDFFKGQELLIKNYFRLNADTEFIWEDSPVSGND